ncbi:MAG: MlaD family protein [Deltaproteobacteria bacterium]|jgi:ABC-type transporter Mla subunit MlaD|nr:MlaD family protein [Deltaproteobacteria bacterium]
MAKKTNYFKIGIFTLSALFLLAAAVLYFGLSSTFRPILQCDTFFDHSVQGLSVGATVNFRGFRVGQVSKINIAASPVQSGQQLIQVRFVLYPELLTGRAKATEAEAREVLQSEIANGLKCSFSFQGVSGLGILDLDYVPANGTEVVVKAKLDPNVVTIPASRGSILAIGESLTVILDSIKGVDFSGLSKTLNEALTGVKTMSGTFDWEIKTMSFNFNSTLDEINNSFSDIRILANKLSAQVDQLNLNAAGEELLGALKQFKQTMAQVEGVLRTPRSTLPQTMENLRVMSENFRDLSEMAKRYPSQLFFGRPPEEVKSR